MQRRLHPFGLLLACIFCAAYPCLLLTAQTPSPAPLSIPVGLEVCDSECITKSSGVVQTWVFHGNKGDARWSVTGDQVMALLTIERFDADKIVIRREDRPNSPVAGFTARYEGTMHDGRIDGTVTAKWPGHFVDKDNPSGIITFPWYATVPITTCDPSAASANQDNFEIATKALRFRQLPSAFQCFLLAAQQGNGQAKALTGLMYRDGVGTAVNYTEAFKWLKAGAIQGDYNAELALSQMYELGTGTPPDAKQAKVWKDQAENNPVIVQQREQARQHAQQEQTNQTLMFMGLAAALEAFTRPDVVYVY
jgi:hypothetical protein